MFREFEVTHKTYTDGIDIILNKKPATREFASVQEALSKVGRERLGWTFSGAISLGVLGGGFNQIIESNLFDFLNKEVDLIKVLVGSALLFAGYVAALHSYNKIEEKSEIMYHFGHYH